MILRARLDLSWSDYAFAVASCMLPRRRDRLESRIRGAFPHSDDAVVCLAVRSGFDLFLQALDLPEGSEVLLSAITIPDMARIVRAHGLVPVPVDVDPESLEPCPDALRAALSPRSRVLVSAHLFGAVVEMEPSRAFAREHGLLFVEDYAQSFAPGRFREDGGYDVRMLSFGPIKTATAMGGGVLFVRDPVVRDRMERLQARYPVQPRGAYVRRLVKYGAMQLMAVRPLFALFRAGCRLAGKEFDAVLREAARGFRGADLFGHLRRRPSVPLLAVMARRLRHDHGRTEARAAAGQALANALPNAVVRPGALVHDHTHWVFPILTPDPTLLMGYLRLQGFDCTQGASSLTAVEPPPERPDIRIPRADAMMARLLFLPAYPEIPAGERLRLAREVGVWTNGNARATHGTQTLVVGSQGA